MSIRQWHRIGIYLSVREKKRTYGARGWIHWTWTRHTRNWQDWPHLHSCFLFLFCFFDDLYFTIRGHRTRTISTEYGVDKIKKETRAKTKRKQKQRKQMPRTCQLFFVCLLLSMSSRISTISTHIHCTIYSVVWFPLMRIYILINYEQITLYQTTPLITRLKAWQLAPKV